MSGIFGIFHRDGAPLDPALLQASVATLNFRGPDAQDFWSQGPIGLGHTLLSLSPESRAEQQPASLDQRLWITADVRLDSRLELLATLREHQPAIPAFATDAELVLHSYSVWGTQCVAHLRGDFSFAIWDAAAQHLFCARDHFGIRPFYFAHLGSLFIFSNTLNTVRFHPQVSGVLQDSAVADFLLFGLNCDNAVTFFRDIRRLPPAHTLLVSRAGLQEKSYWSPPVDGRLRYQRPAEYVEHFQSLLNVAVADRLSAHSAGILLSGGLDSGAVAATAKSLAASSRQKLSLHSYTFVHASLPHDQEGFFARQTADFLSISNYQLSVDSLVPFALPADPSYAFPDPIDNPFAGGVFADYRTIAADCRILLSGEGGDNLMHFQMGPYIKQLWRTHAWRRLAADLSSYLLVRPFPWRGLRTKFLQAFGKDPLLTPFPTWLNPDFSRRLNLPERWRTGNQLPTPLVPHPVHPAAHASLLLPQWTTLFESEDAQTTHHPVQVVYPFLDLRLVEFLLALPPFPWFFQKHLLRVAMRGRLPESVRRRKKTPLQGDPTLQRFQQDGGVWRSSLPWDERLLAYISSSPYPNVRGTLNPEQASLDARPHCFNFWLQTSRKVQYK